MEIIKKNALDIATFTADLRKTLLLHAVAEWQNQGFTAETIDSSVMQMAAEFDRAVSTVLLNHLSGQSLPVEDATEAPQTNLVNGTGAKKRGRPKAGSKRAKDRAAKARETRARNKAAKLKENHVDHADGTFPAASDATAPFSDEA